MPTGLRTMTPVRTASDYIGLMDAKSVGVLLLVGAAVLAVIGLALMAGLLGWFGKLPGDLRYEKDNVKVYAPIASMLLVSLVLSIALAVINRLR